MSEDGNKLGTEDKPGTEVAEQRTEALEDTAEGQRRQTEDDEAEGPVLEDVARDKGRGQNWRMRRGTEAGNRGRA